jgi:gluconate 2-dehydrogenase gamma chain
MSDKLEEWNDSLPLCSQQQNKLQQRRAFLSGLVKTSIAAATLPATGLLSGCTKSSQTITNNELIKNHPWHTFSVVQEHLFPDDQNGPSASDVNSTAYLQFVLDAPDTDPAERKMILDGVNWLSDIANEQKGKSFIALSSADQDEILKKIAGTRVGESWLSSLLMYIFEALLSDPVYGGNPDGIGWKWLEHQPGFPHPPLNKRYTELI